MKKVSVFFLFVFLLISLNLAQDSAFKSQFKILRQINNESSEFFSIQGRAGSKSLFVISELGTYDYDTEDWLGGFIHIASTKNVVFSVLCGALISQNVRLHFIFSGPTFASTVTDWGKLSKGDIAEVSIIGETKYFKKGCYMLTVIAETNKSMSGGTAVGTYRIYFY